MARDWVSFPSLHLWFSCCPSKHSPTKWIQCHQPQHPSWTGMSDRNHWRDPEREIQLAHLILGSSTETVGCLIALWHLQRISGQSATAVLVPPEDRRWLLHGVSCRSSCASLACDVRGRAGSAGKGSLGSPCRKFTQSWDVLPFHKHLSAGHSSARRGCSEPGSPAHVKAHNFLIGGFALAVAHRQGCLCSALLSPLKRSPSWGMWGRIHMGELLNPRKSKWQPLLCSSWGEEVSQFSVRSGDPSPASPLWLFWG